MKIVQVGILVALVICAGLLFLVYRNQQTSLRPAVTPSVERVQSVEPASETAASPDVTPEAPAATPMPRAAAEPRKPSALREPATQRRKRNGTPVEVAQAPLLSEPAQMQYAQPPMQAPVAARTEVPLNPPPGAQMAPPTPRVPRTATLPAGTVVTIRLAETISTDTNKTGDTFTATLDQPIVVDGLEIAQKGADVSGKLIDCEKAGHVSGLGELSLQLTRLHTSDGQNISIQTDSYQKQGASEKKQSAEKVGGGAVLGAIIGAIAGGGKGAAIGAGAGGAAGGGVAVATHGKPVVLPVETRLSFRLQQPVTLTERIN